ncbi:hypothetical protein D1007_53217 [Hordeum vulgare]|nr:hypothetical protein D1007_53217 [Hordeum vulgare]
MELGVHLVETPMRKMDVMVVYTNDPVMVEDSINTMEQLLAEHDKYKVATVPCERFTRFANSPDYRFATVDTTNNPKVLKTSGLACQKLVDICGHYKIWGSKKDMDSHVYLAEAIIKPYYKGMKVECDNNKPAWHNAWVKSLDEHQLQTTAKEAYTCYEMFTRIVDMRNYLLLEYMEGSNHKQCGGVKCHMK